MANIEGTRTTGSILAARLPVDMAKQIALLDPNEAPFVTFLKLAKRGMREVYNPKFNWLEDDLLTSSTAVNHGAGYDENAVSIVVDDGSIFTAGDILNLPATGENMLVTEVSTNTLTVTRGYGTTSAASMLDNAVVLKIGSAMTEASSVPTSLTTQETEVYNYTQIFRTPVSFSGTELASDMYGGNDRAYQRGKKLLEHKRDIARAMYFGQKKLDATGPRRTMGGLVSFLTQSVAFASGGTTLTYSNFDQNVALKAFAHGSKEKLLIAGPYLSAAINSWAMGDLVTDVSKEATYGIAVKNLITSYGTFKVIYDPLLDGAVYGGYGFALDPANIRYAYLKGRDTKLYTDIQDPDVDGVIDEYRTECSLEVKLPESHVLITGAYVPSA